MKLSVRRSSAGAGKIIGDGWKDTTKIDEVVVCLERPASTTLCAGTISAHRKRDLGSLFGINTTSSSYGRRCPFIHRPALRHGDRRE